MITYLLTKLCASKPSFVKSSHIIIENYLLWTAKIPSTLNVLMTNVSSDCTRFSIVLHVVTSISTSNSINLATSVVLEMGINFMRRSQVKLWYILKISLIHMLFQVKSVTIARLWWASGCLFACRSCDKHVLTLQCCANTLLLTVIKAIPNKSYASRPLEWPGRSKQKKSAYAYYKIYKQCYCMYWLPAEHVQL